MLYENEKNKQQRNQARQTCTPDYHYIHQKSGPIAKSTRETDQIAQSEH